MITLITGLPGAGKSLYALHFVSAWAEREQRTVYYSGIKDLKLPWVELVEPEQWHTLPQGSIIVVDECQRVFRPRHVGSQVPRHVSELETHRHKGLDLVLITQHPKLLDPNARRLVGQHFHVVRSFGMRRATVHEWGEVNESPDQSREGSIRHEWGYPSQLFKAYVSAEVHTHKRRVPFRVFLLLLVPVLVIALGWYVWSWYASRLGADKPKGPVVAGAVSGGSPGQKADTARPGIAELGYYEKHQPRIAGLAFTAPVYDELTKPVRAPYPAACLQSSSRCSCYSEQGTRLDVPASLCRQIVSTGLYLAWDVDAGRRGVAGGTVHHGAPAASSGVVAHGAPAAEVAQSSVGPVGVEVLPGPAGALRRIAPASSSRTETGEPGKLPSQ